MPIINTLRKMKCDDANAISDAVNINAPIGGFIPNSPLWGYTDKGMFEIGSKEETRKYESCGSRVSSKNLSAKIYGIFPSERNCLFGGGSPNKTPNKRGRPKKRSQRFGSAQNISAEQTDDGNSVSSEKSENDEVFVLPVLQKEDEHNKELVPQKTPLSNRGRPAKRISTGSGRRSLNNETLLTPSSSLNATPSQGLLDKSITPIASILGRSNSRRESFETPISRELTSLSLESRKRLSLTENTPPRAKLRRSRRLDSSTDFDIDFGEDNEQLMDIDAAQIQVEPAIDFSTITLDYATEVNPNSLIAAHTVMQIGHPFVAGVNLVPYSFENLHEWLDGTSIYAFLCLLASRDSRRIIVADPLLSGSNPQFIQMVSNIQGSIYDNQKGPSVDIVLIPVYFPAHFTLLVHDVEHGTFFADSIIREDGRSRIDADKLFVLRYILSKLVPDTQPDQFNIVELPVHMVTQQEDGNSCAYFTILFAEFWLLLKTFILTPLDKPTEKKRILWHINELFKSDNFVYHPPKNASKIALQPERRNGIEKEIDCFDSANDLYTDQSIYAVDPLVLNRIPFVRDNDPENVVIYDPPDYADDHSEHDFDDDVDLIEDDVAAVLQTIVDSVVYDIEGCTAYPIMPKFGVVNRNIPGKVKKFTPRCYKSHKNMGCAAWSSGHLPDYESCGDMGSSKCKHCDALLFKYEVCRFCSNGKIKLPPLSQHPQVLIDLMTSKDKDGKHYVANQLRYNNMLCFGSIEVGRKASPRGGPVAVLLNGEFKRVIHGLYEKDDEVPSLDQLYILDPATAVKWRTQQQKQQGFTVRDSLLTKLDKVLRDFHPLAKELLTFHEQYQDILKNAGPDGIKEYTLVIRNERDAPADVKDSSLHPRQVNLPKTCDGLFAIWSADDDTAMPVKGVWITTKKGDQKPLVRFDRSIDTLCYTLIFPCGDDGYHPAIPIIKIAKEKKSVKKPKEISLVDDGVDSASDNESVADSDISIFDGSDCDDDTEIVSKKTYTGTAKKREFASIREFLRYRLAFRPDSTDFHPIWSCGGGLSQQFVLDYCARIDDQVHDMMQQAHSNLRASLPDPMLQWLAKQAGKTLQKAGKLEKDKKVTPDDIGNICLFTKHMPGTRPYFQEKFSHAVTIMARVRQPGRALFMLTWTCSSTWPEIKDNIFKNGQTVTDRCDLQARVYEAKAQHLMDLMDKPNGLFGEILGYVQSREFQKRGGPHFHRVFATEIPDIPDAIDEYVWAVIPTSPPANDKSEWAEKMRKLRELVIKHQLHDCNPNWCMNNDKRQCDKGFPKPFSNQTLLFDDKSPVYYRPSPSEGGESVMIKKKGIYQTYNNSHVVPYNPFILLMTQTHHNIERCYGHRFGMKYVLWYPFKGASFSYLQSKRVGDGKINIDEPAHYKKCYYRSGPEGVSRILSYKYVKFSHSVFPLNLHLPDQQKEYYNIKHAKEAADKVAIGHQRQTHLTAYWHQCELDSEIAKTLFEIIPEKYTFNKTEKEWRKRVYKKKNTTFGRIYPVSPRNRELYALYCLMRHYPGGIQSLKTVDKQVYDTFVEAATIRGLLYDNDVWDNALQEGSQFLMPREQRNLFASIIVFGHASNLFQLWEKHKDSMIDTRAIINNKERLLRYDRALSQIQRYLKANQLSLDSYGLPMPTVAVTDPTADEQLDAYFFPAANDPNDDQPDETVDTASVRKGNYTPDQLEVVDKLRTSINTSPREKSVPRLFYISGDGGTGKTFLYNKLILELRADQKRTNATATTGVAATLLLSGLTMHSCFRLGINPEASFVPTIPVEGFFARRIGDADLLIIDEVSMLDRKNLEIVERLCRLYAPYERQGIPWGGLTVALSGDFKQRLPITKGGMMEAIDACILRSQLYSAFTDLKLTTNMRVGPGEQTFRDWLKKVGRGLDGFDKFITIPKENLVESRDDLIDFVYGDTIAQANTKELLKRLIAAPLNETVDLLNDEIVKKINKSEKQYLSTDESRIEKPFHVDSDEVEIRALNLYKPSGLPYHDLRLREGTVIMLLKNLNVSQGLCNGTRLVVKNLGDNLISGITMPPSGQGKEIGICRYNCITMPPSGQGKEIGICRYNCEYEELRPDGVKFVRFQFPVRPAFAMTVDKAQGQTLDRLGVDLSKPFFAFHQPYAIFSRVKTFDSLRVYAPTSIYERNSRGDALVPNVLAIELLKQLYPEDYV